VSSQISVRGPAVTFAVERKCESFVWKNYNAFKTLSELQKLPTGWRQHMSSVALWPPIGFTGKNIEVLAQIHNYHEIQNRFGLA